MAHIKVKKKDRAKNDTSWDAAKAWYSDCVGEQGHYYHRKLILPNVLRILCLKEKSSLLDLGCGQGVLSRHLPKEIIYYGVDLSKKLIYEAKRQAQDTISTFYVANVCQQLPIDKTDFDAVCFILSLQNMEHQEKAIATAVRHLKPGGKLLLVLNHPCFRIPRQSSWGIDETAKLQYRRIQRYMTPMAIPLQIHPSQGDQSEATYSYHHPLSQYSLWLHQAGCTIASMEEWCSDKLSQGTKSRMEDRARNEIPLFLTILASQR